MTPQYKEILSKIGQQLNERKSIIFKRNLVIYVFIVIGIVLGKIGFESPAFMIISSILIAISFTISAYLTFIFKIEQDIWIDSHFDGRDLSTDDSWRISRKLALPALKLYLYCLSIYILPMILIMAATAFALFALGNHLSGLPTYMFILIYFAGFILPAIVAVYFSLYKLRYIAFSFLDTYGQLEYSPKRVVRNSYELSKIGKSEALMKAVVSDIGASSAKGIANIIIDGLGSLPVISSVPFAKGYASININTATEFARSIAFYMLYRAAHKQLYQTEQVVNEAVYKL